MAELNVTKKSVAALLKDMQRRKFVIPDFQRPYKWDHEKCEILWQDLTGFFEERKPHENPDQEYYLGTIVTCQSEDSAKNKELQVIDGQQRLTSFLLLLRAFYKKLQGMDATDPNVRGLMNQIAPCIWDVDAISGLVNDFSLVHLESRVATDADNEALHEILKTGVPKDGAKDLYSSNYRFFLEQCEVFAKNNTLTWQPLCVSVMRNCIILPIECEKFDTALTIFSTLNDRGMPLSDSDIFKAQLYRNRSTPEDKRKFTEEWKELTEAVEDAGITLDDLFRYYTHVIRARSGDTSKEIGLRKFYAGNDNKFSKLKAPEVMAELAELADFWEAINTGAGGGIGDSINQDSRKLLHCLSLYPNEYWKYVVSVYFFRPGDKAAFATQFPTLLRFMVAWMFSQFILHPTVNAIKDACFQFGIDIIAGKPLSARDPLPPDFDRQLGDACTWKIARGLILLHAYLNPSQDLLPSKFEIEHIFPRRWQTANYNGWTHDDAEAFLERFGNKVAIEKKVNIQAGNGYFGKKKQQYDKSKFVAVKELSKYPSNDWVKTDIEARESTFLREITRFFVTNLATSPTAPAVVAR